MRTTFHRATLVLAAIASIHWQSTGTISISTRRVPLIKNLVCCLYIFFNLPWWLHTRDKMYKITSSLNKLDDAPYSYDISRQICVSYVLVGFNESEISIDRNPTSNPHDLGY